MYKKNYSFYLVAVLAIMLFFTVSLGGCGGSNGSLSGSNQSNENDEQETPAPTRAVWEEETSINLLDALAGFDFDDDGKMDFLDFDDVGQYYLSDNVNAVGLAEDSSYKDASEAKISVPSMVWLKKLHPQNENPNIFQVYLESDKEYTFEFSKNLTETLNSVIPEIRIFDPENAALPFYEASSLRPEITPIPAESPSLICYTIKPEVSGWYLVVVSSQKSSVDVYHDTEIQASETEETDADGVIFVYQEMRNEKDEPGYFTRFKFSDINGNTTESLSIRDIIELRKIFLELNQTYLDEMYGQNAVDDEFGNGTEDLEFLFNEESKDVYLSYLDKVQRELGLVDASEISAAKDADNASMLRIAQMDTLGLADINENNDGEDDKLDSADIALKNFYRNYVYPNDKGYATYSPKEYSIEKVIANNADNIFWGGGVKTAADSPQRSTIDADISGIPYEPTYRLGTAFSAVTYASPKGAVRVSGLEEMLEEANKVRTPIPITTKFWTELVTTREEAEKHSEVSGGGGIGLAKKAAGTATFSVGTSSNYKYGLTSMTLVIHFEVIESDYRLLSAGAYNDLAFENKLHKKAKKLRPDKFRDEYGDYFVAGYQYGACYEASISITTDTIEQLDEVKSSFNLNGSYNDVTVSADMKQKMNDTFKKNNARININVVTTGLGNKIPTILPITQSNDVSGLQQVFDEYAKFHKQVVDDMNSNNRSNFVPIRVYMMKWRSLAAIADQVLDRWGHLPESDGTIPITPKQKADANAMNSALANLRAYYNASEPARSTIPAADNLAIVTSFDYLVGKVNAYGEDFYTTGTASGDRITEELPKIIEISTKCKDLTDRYVFYQKLIQAQKKELEVTSNLNGKLSLWPNDDDGDSKRLQYVHQCPFGSNGGGESGFRSFPMSSTVTEDFAACEENPKKVFDTKLNKEWYCHKRVYIDTRKGGTSRLEWWKDQREDSKGAKDWQPDVGDAYIEANAKDGSRAVFAFVNVESSASKAYEDRRRFISGNNPAVGSQNVGFRFMSSYGNSVNWTIEGVAIRLRPEDYPFNGLID